MPPVEEKMDTTAELELQSAILTRAAWLNHFEPTVENTRYLEHCREAVEVAYAAEHPVQAAK